MKTVILAGGFGTRLSEHTDSTPKPMVEIGGAPILWHIMKIFGAANLNEFVVALGYRADVVKRYFLDYHRLQNDLTITAGGVEVHDGAREDWRIHLIETGIGTQTGGRIKRLEPHLRDGTFMLAYGDCVADVDCRQLLEFHRAHGRLATVTAVRPPARFGSLAFDGDLVSEFVEKPQTGEGWINGGFFVLEPGVLDYIGGDDTIWERDPLEALAQEGQLVAFKHEGFWQPMDTLRDVRFLEALWQSGDVPWRRWE